MKFTVIADGLHLRIGAGTRFDSMLLMHKDDVLDWLDVDASGTWLRLKQTGAGGKTGWASARYVLPEGTSHAPWLEIAVKEIGVKEQTDSASPAEHPRILQYMATVNDLSRQDKSSDETPWCSCFVNWCVEAAGIYGTDSATAKSWGNWRNGILPTQGQLGDIAVFDRDEPDPRLSGGHVGFLISLDMKQNRVLLLGGNQGNAVRYRWFPLDGVVPAGTRYRLLSNRRI